MILLILKSYLSIIVSVGIAAMLLFALGVYLIFKQQNRKTPALRIISSSSDNKPAAVTLHDLSAIAGDDVLTTQLDLARAYVETGKPHLAKKILADVIANGNAAQQQETRHLSGVQ